MAESGEPTVADALTRQMAGQWHGLMGLMTQQGASRDDIMELALSVSSVVLVQTADALWAGPADYTLPHGRAEVPAMEFDSATRFVELEIIIANALEEIRARKQEEPT